MFHGQTKYPAEPDSRVDGQGRRILSGGRGGSCEHDAGAEEEQARLRKVEERRRQNRDSARRSRVKRKVNIFGVAECVKRQAVSIAELENKLAMLEAAIRSSKQAQGSQDAPASSLGADDECSDDDGGLLSVRNGEMRSVTVSEQDSAPVVPVAVHRPELPCVDHPLNLCGREEAEPQRLPSPSTVPPFNLSSHPSLHQTMTTAVEALPVQAIPEVVLLPGRPFQQFAGQGLKRHGSVPDLRHSWHGGHHRRSDQGFDELLDTSLSSSTQTGRHGCGGKSYYPIPASNGPAVPSLSSLASYARNSDPPGCPPFATAFSCQFQESANQFIAANCSSSSPNEIARAWGGTSASIVLDAHRVSHSVEREATLNAASKQGGIAAEVAQLTTAAPRRAAHHAEPQPGDIRELDIVEVLDALTRPAWS